MVNDMCPDVVVDVVDPPIVPVHCRQSSPQIAPFLATVPGQLVVVAVMVQVGDEVQPHNKNPVRDKVEVEHEEGSHEEGEACEEGSHGHPARCGCQHIVPFVGLEQVAAGMEMRTRLSWAPRPQVEWVGEHGEGYGEAEHPGGSVKAPVQPLGEGMPGLILVDMAMVLMMRPVANPPAMVGYEDGGVEYVAHHAVEPRVVGEAPVPAVVAEDEERPEHGSLRRPVERPGEAAVEARGGGSEGEHHHHVAQHVPHGSPGVLHPTVLGDSGADVGQTKRGRRARVEVLTRRRRSIIFIVVLLHGGHAAGGCGHTEAEADIPKWERKCNGATAAGEEGERRDAGE